MKISIYTNKIWSIYCISMVIESKQGIEMSTRKNFQKRSHISTIIDKLAKSRKNHRYFNEISTINCQLLKKNHCVKGKL